MGTRPRAITSLLFSSSPSPSSFPACPRQSFPLLSSFRAPAAQVRFSSCWSRQLNHVPWPVAATKGCQFYSRNSTSLRWFTTGSTLFSEQKDQSVKSPKPLQKIRKNILKNLNTRENIYTIPNILTFSRLIAAPAIGYLILHDQHVWAFGLFAYAGITDLLDGWIARKWKLQTVVGSVIDPMADKTLMTILVGCLAAQGSLPLPLATLILGRDVSLAVAAIYYRWTSLPEPKTLTRYWDFSLPSAEVHPTTISKWNTFLQLGLIGFTLAIPLLLAVSPPQTPPIASDAENAANFSPLHVAPSASGSIPAPPVPLTSQQQQQRRQSLTQTTPASGSKTTFESIPDFLPYCQGLVAATTLWSGASYVWTKDAVRILGDDEVLKRKQGMKGRAVVGITFAIVVAAAVGMWVRGGGLQATKQGRIGDGAISEEKTERA